jgi:hypothetical protein
MGKVETVVFLSLVLDLFGMSHIEECIPGEHTNALRSFHHSLATISTHN